MRGTLAIRKLDAHRLRTVVALVFQSLKISIVPGLLNLDFDGFSLVGELDTACCFIDRSSKRAVLVICYRDRNRMYGGVVEDTLGLGFIGRHELLNLVGIDPLLGLGSGSSRVHADARSSVCLDLRQIIDNRAEGHRAVSLIRLFIHNRVSGVARVGELEEEHIVLQLLAHQFLGCRNGCSAGSLVFVGKGKLLM